MRSIIVGVLIVGFTSPLLARKEVIVPLAVYDRETRYVDITPADSRTFIQVGAVLTGDGTDWPGQGQIALTVPATALDKNITVLVGQGDLFPTNYGRMVVINPSWQTELVWLESRVGDVLTVKRGYENSKPMAIEAGATLWLLDLITVKFQKTLDGVNWVGAGAFTCAGGPPEPDSPFERCGASFSMNRGGVMIAQPGDLRVEFTNRVPMAVGLVLTLREPSDF